MIFCFCFFLFLFFFVFFCFFFFFVLRVVFIIDTMLHTSLIKPIKCTVVKISKVEIMISMHFVSNCKLMCNKIYAVAFTLFLLGFFFFFLGTLVRAITPVGAKISIYFTKKNLFFLVYTITFTKEIIYSTNLFNKIFILIHFFFIISFNLLNLENHCNP